ncbi:hypothetical protein GF360_01435 [candidate division WWE3 bacterium]|nr:hypothetical protein [candidate division WWE3 bacterium]
MTEPKTFPGKPKTTWNLDLIGNTTLQKVQKEAKKFIEKWKKRKDYLQKPSILKEALDDYNQWEEKYSMGGDEAYKLILKLTLDQNNAKLKAQYNKLHEKYIELYNSLQFFMLNISKIPPKEQPKFLKAPELAKYRYFLKGQFEIAKYLLTEKEERILNLKSKVAFGNWVDMTENLISKETRDGKSFSEILSETSDPNKSKRDKAAKWLNEIFENHIDPGEHELNSVLENAKINQKLRGYKRPDEPRHVGDDIETEVVDALLTAVTSRYDISQKFYELKAKLLGFEQLEYHERNVPYGKAEKEYEFEDALALVNETFYDLDPEFAQYFHNYFKQGQFDAFPKKGKSSGAACFSGLKTQPIYIYLNFTKKLRNVTTIAHEMGHAIHSELVFKSQPAIYAGTSLATAETASTLMEDFVVQRILHDADDELKLALQMEQLNDSVSTIQRQIACYKFEQELHESFRREGYLSKEQIGELFQKHMAAYMGDFVEQSKGSQNWWLYWSHIRRHFYVYSYASGLLISKSLQKRVKETPEFIKEVKEVLALGTSKSPKDAFLEIDIDISNPDFWLQGLKEQSQLLDDTWTLAEKLGKI